ncbi:MAG: hypothetical protein BWX80_02244 [Candidatus Hydrogenedentes bacterium ADurb.Bin101]|nr:MAG: hypothetical protein BWX80_02244 [Candidatus Hydrogenedentes bacterium ADurb.Bin101]
MGDLNRVFAGHRRGGNINLLNIIQHIVSGLGSIGWIQAVQYVREKDRRPAGPINAEVQVIDQYRCAYIKAVLRGTGRIRPTEGGAYRVRAVPGKGKRLIRLRRAHAVLDQVNGSGIVRLGLDLVRRRFRIHHPPAVTVIRPGVTQILRGVDDETFEHA